jgi:hypothetical protein
MSTKNKHVIVIAISAVALANIAFGTDGKELNFTDFYQALETGTDEQAVQIGQKIFEQLEIKYRVDAGFRALKSKITAADYLANQMITQLKKATGRRMCAAAEEVLKSKAESEKRDLLLLAPAKQFCETSRQIFSNPVSIDHLEDEEKRFLADFYNLKLRNLTSEIAKAGQALAIAEPSFNGTYDYVLVLPLLHTSQTRPVNIDVLPKWMRQSGQLEVFSDSCLLHYGHVEHAMAFARAAAGLDRKNFSQVTFYKSASEKCAKQLPYVAVDCLQRAISLVDANELDERLELQFDIAQIWLNSKNFTLAAGEAKKIADGFPEHKRCGDAVWLYFYALSRANNTETILASIDIRSQMFRLQGTAYVYEVVGTSQTERPSGPGSSS